MYLKVQYTSPRGRESQIIEDENVLELFTDLYNTSMLDDDFYLPEKRDFIVNIKYELFEDYGDYYTIECVTLVGEKSVTKYYPISDKWYEQFK